MNELFLHIVNMSISASWLVLAVLLLRLALKKAPKWICVLLWGIVAVRLLCPLSIESALSLIPSAKTIPKTVMTGPSFDLQTGISPIDQPVNHYLGSRYFEGVTVPAGNGLHVINVLTIVWVTGILLLAAYTVISYLRLCRKVDTAVRLRENIFQSENVCSPFTLGLIRPGIYLPFNMEAQDQALVIAHEQAHILRRDHWIKPFGFLLLAIYWFNPLLWLAYVLLCRDIELACDEKVIKEFNCGQRADYAQALLICSTHRGRITACPLAFGEVGVKERVKSVMHYKKPAFWAIVVSLILCGIMAICFLTDPRRDNFDVRIHVPAGVTGGFVFSYEDVMPISLIGNQIVITAGDELDDTEIILVPAADTPGQNDSVPAPIRLTAGTPVKVPAEKGVWYRVGIRVDNPSGEDLNFYVNFEHVTIRTVDYITWQTPFSA